MGSLYEVYYEDIWFYTAVCCVRTPWLAFNEEFDWLKNDVSLEPLNAISYDLRGVRPTKNIASLDGLILP